MTDKNRGIDRRVADQVPLSDTTRYFLAALVEKSPQHGYSLVRKVYELSEGVIAPRMGNAYISLARWVEKGLIEKHEPSNIRGRERVNYSVTEFGLEVFEKDSRFISMTARKLSRIRRSQVNP